MEQNSDNKIEVKNTLIYYYKKNKIKIIILVTSIIILILSAISFQIYYKKKNELISEKYIKAGIFYLENEEDKSKQIYEEILILNNSFYSTLALNSILEKNLEGNKDKILEYFRKVEKLQKNKDQKDNLNFKKALYLLKNSGDLEAKKILEELINSNSNLKNLAEEILAN